jgi:hypothetical protein
MTVMERERRKEKGETRNEKRETRNARSPDTDTKARALDGRLIVGIIIIIIIMNKDKEGQSKGQVSTVGSGSGHAPRGARRIHICYMRFPFPLVAY